MAIAYGIIFALSLFMPPLYFSYVHKKQNEPCLFVLFLCVCAVNLGCFLTSLSKTVEFALWANKITCLGQAFVPACMFMIISKLCGFTYKKWIVGLLIGLALIMLAIVLGNIGMWIIEKITTWNFELLAISYVMSMLAFFFVYILLQDYILIKLVPAPIAEDKSTIAAVDSAATAK
jgi:hypothetical protein